MSEPTPEARELDRALAALYLEVPEAVARDVAKIVHAALRAADAGARQAAYDDISKIIERHSLAAIAEMTKAAIASPSAMAEHAKDTAMQPSDDQVKYMVDRFLSWKLPQNFNPDAGISYTRPNYHPSVDATPTGTNLFDATQAEAMVRHMLEGSEIAERTGTETAPPLTADMITAGIAALGSDDDRLFGELVSDVYRAMERARLDTGAAAASTSADKNDYERFKTLLRRWLYRMPESDYYALHAAFDAAIREAAASPWREIAEAARPALDTLNSMISFGYDYNRTVEARDALRAALPSPPASEGKL